jgi:hypothetical protein
MSHPIPFRQCNSIIKKPDGFTSKECCDLELYRDGKYCISKWQFTDIEIEELKKNNGKCFVWVLGETMPPIYISPTDPFK